MGLWLCRMCCANHRESGRSELTNVSIASRRRQAPETTTASRYTILLLGASGSGKTEVGHYLSELQRDANDHGPTNGVRHFRVRTPMLRHAGYELALTEVGGSLDMQRIWPHYYAKAVAIVYCFDLSASYATLQDAFQLLARILAHSAVRHKCVLLVATHAQSSACEAVQLYDIENAFGLEALARQYGCPLRMCYFDIAPDGGYVGDIWPAIKWLLQHLRRHELVLAQRIKHDTNMLKWQAQQHKLLANGNRRVQRQRFGRHRKLWPHPSVPQHWLEVRPQSAPTSIFTISGARSAQKSTET